MPLGNLTSQFFANIYLNELDYFAKHKLKVKHYLRYVDDFVIIHESEEQLMEWKIQIDKFLRESLKLELHPDKSRINLISNGLDFVGFRNFYYHRLLRKRNIRKIKSKILKFNQGLISREKITESFEGWIAYAKWANTFNKRKALISEINFSAKKEIQPIKFEFSSQETLFLFKKGLSINDISRIKAMKVSTFYEHLSKLVEHGNLSIWDVLPREKIKKIFYAIKTPKDKLKEIKFRLKDDSIVYDEINCVISYLKFKAKHKI